MMGRSRRFFDAGYPLPKYQLPLGRETVFSAVVRSFRRYFDSLPFVFIVRDDYGTGRFVAQSALDLGLRDFRIVELSGTTRGQADTVYAGTAGYAEDAELLIFNIDTVLDDFVYPSAGGFGDGFVDVFEGAGDHWSFVRADAGGRVLQTAEKQRISSLCSNGVYGFRRLCDFRAAFRAQAARLPAGREIFVAPLYNELIGQGRDIRCRVVHASTIIHCGTPSDYELARQRA
jgi:hypothetical protein